MMAALYESSMMTPQGLMNEAAALTFNDQVGGMEDDA
jgi:hypothetical protein